MNWSPIIGVGIAIVMSVHLTASLRAECIGLGPREMKRQAGRVLEGTVVLLAHDVRFDRRAVEVKVHRVWKGDVTATAVFSLDHNVDAPRLNVGDRRVFFALSETAADRRRLFGVVDHQPTLFVLSCGGAEPPHQWVVSQLGRARTPK